MPPKQGQVSDGGKWTDETKLEFIAKWFFAQPSQDWNLATVPEGRTKYACQHLFRALKKQYGPDARDDKPAKPMAAKSGAAGPKTKKRKVSEANLDEEECDLPAEQRDDDGIIKGEEMEQAV